MNLCLFIQFKCRTVIFFLLFVNIIVGCSCNNHGRRDEFVSVPVKGDSVVVKISYPEVGNKNDKIVIWNTSTLTDEFCPDSMPTGPMGKVDINIKSMLRDSLLKNGYINIEYLERNDSIVTAGYKFRTSDTYTKFEDFESVLGYIDSRRELKKKNIILIGHSEGGNINAMAAAKHPEVIYAIVQLTTCAIDGKENSEYQGHTNDSLFMRNYFFIPDIYKTANKISSLKTHSYELSMEGCRQFRLDILSPLDSIVYHYNNRDTIANQIVLYLQSRWEREDDKTKQFHGNFENYCKANNILSVLSPQQIALKKWQPELYYPYIKCPVLAVYGTKDERIEWSSSKKAMEAYLNQGGNTHYKFIVLEGYGHWLTKMEKPRSYYIEDFVINEIVDSIKQL
ncbi:hypothetical protein AGMMS50239_09430 [Bacteroidia bacterium]|nr:hypothetical protein AGMMS50239_09430 [Bacteroidia bacterium]